MSDNVSSSVKSAWVAGGTGLVGRELLARLRNDPGFVVVHCARRPLPEDPSARQVDFDQREAPSALGRCDVGFCALGTTIKKAGSKPAFERVDHDAVLNFAGWCKAAGARTFVLVTSLGADPQSGVFYNQVKGRVQDSVRALGFARFVVLQPSVLDGDRDESRPLEKLALGAMRVAAPLMLGALRRYRPSAATDVAQAMVRLVDGPDEAMRVVPAEAIPTLAG